ncbi:hypothetical protein FKR81_41535 [Lentzea tibetensis]|uniref:Uncharacterized protein n=1 Tax=Lentzea tibetensis TaxID=2591470 RepID=A0A563EFK8_9PSEU|nr:hypothetical protein [Lentzea tibetensis]TWP44173.1 hypothetical protein FKR81_41535 [Lentzea tibetensis]
MAKLLSERGVTAEVHPLLVDPASGEQQVEVLAVRITHAERSLVMPVVPGTAPLRLYTASAGDEPLGDPVTVVAEPASVVAKQQWVSAAALADATMTALEGRSPQQQSDLR